MNDTSSDSARNLEARVTKAGEAIGDRVQSATAATAAAASQAQKVVQDITATTATAVGQAKKVLGDAGEAAQQAWSQAGGVAEDVVDAGRRATRSVSRQIGEKPLIAVLVGFALGYVAGLWIQGASRPGRTADDKANAKAPSP
jgi:cell division septum initiation protein DivIVA